MNRRSFISSLLALPVVGAIVAKVAPAEVGPIAVEEAALSPIAPSTFARFPELRSPTPGLHGGPLTLEQFNRMAEKLKGALGRPKSHTYRWTPDKGFHYVFDDE